MQLWPDPRDGIDASDAPWNWIPVGTPLDGGATKNPPNHRPGWRRWYFFYRKPNGTKLRLVRIEIPIPGNGSTPMNLQNNHENENQKSASGYGFEEENPKVLSTSKRGGFSTVL